MNKTTIMKGKYITTDILLACLSKKPEIKDIHQQLKETIAAYKMILTQSNMGAFAKDNLRYMNKRNAA